MTAGTQVIDRCRRYLKDRIAINQHAKRGLFALKAKLRSAQKQYWHKNKDLWTAGPQERCVLGPFNGSLGINRLQPHRKGWDGKVWLMSVIVRE